MIEKLILKPMCKLNLKVSLGLLTLAILHMWITEAAAISDDYTAEAVSHANATGIESAKSSSC